MVWGWSWSMKIAERSSAMSASYQVAELVEDHAAHVVAGQLAVRAGGRGDGGGLRTDGPRLEPGEVAEGLGRVRGVGEARPLRQVARLEVLRQRRAPEEARADGHGGRQVGVEPGAARAAGGVDGDPEHAHRGAVGE